MQVEIEAKFLDVNHEQVCDALRKNGAVCEASMRLMRRAIIEAPEMVAKNAFVRVRDEGDKVTMTYRQFDELSVDGAKEIEIIVDDFENAIALAVACGLKQTSLQESKRETWRLGDCEVVLDEWPWLKPYVEIEGSSEQSVRSVASMLGFSWDDAVFGDVMVAYRAQYPHLTDSDTVGRIPVVRFEDSLPTLLLAE